MNKTDEPEDDKTGAERRRHRRSEVATVIQVSPNGHENRSVVYDMSRSGARIGLPRDPDFGVGAGVRLFFPRVHGSTIMLGAKIVRVAIDHLGIEFGPGQEAVIHKLLISLTPD
jgi:hypothetical protein